MAILHIAKAWYMRTFISLLIRHRDLSSPVHISDQCSVATLVTLHANLQTVIAYDKRLFARSGRWFQGPWCQRTDRRVGIWTVWMPRSHIEQSTASSKVAGFESASEWIHSVVNFRQGFFFLFYSSSFWHPSCLTWCRDKARC